MNATPLELLVEDTPSDDHVRQLVDGLVAYNDGHAQAESREPLGVFLRAGARIVGGADGYTHWNWLYVSHLWVDDGIRHQGAGRQLLSAIEGAAKQRGCRAAWLDTFSFQALDFYRHLGYQLFGELRDFPPGHDRHYLWKSLDQPASGAT